MGTLSRQGARLKRLYYRIRMSDFIWRNILNRQARLLYTQNLLENSHRHDTQIVGALRRDGIAIVHVTDILPTALWEEFKAYIEAKISSPEIQKHIHEHRTAPIGRGDKYYNIPLEENPILDLSNPLFKVAGHPNILNIVNKYLGMYGKFRGMRLWASVPVPQGADPHASQNWHRDPEDKKIVKTFIYFNDVDESAGPFSYIKHSHEGGRWRHLYPQIPPMGSYAPKGTIERIVPHEDILTATGKAGTMIFCDTSGLHKGGYCTEKVRYMYLGVYATSASTETLGYRPGSVDLSALSPAARYALENSQ